MPTPFQLASRPAGIAAASAAEGASVPVIYREYLAPTDPLLLERLESFQRAIFGSIPSLPPASRLDHLLVVIQPNLSAVAYINELNIRAEIRPNRSIRAGEPVRVSDIEDIASVDLDVEIPTEAAFVFMRSFGWRRSLIYDLGPLQRPPVPRDYPLEKALAEQALLLLGLANVENDSAGTRLEHMREGLSRLDSLLEDRVEDEKEYQRLLEAHPWMLGGVYDRIQRHTSLDDERIPDFTGRRSSDLHHDVIEIKQPFLPLFKRSGELAANFNDSWNQAEKYLTFGQRQRTSLREEKGVAFENPQAVLVIGSELTPEQRKLIREKERLAGLITVRTYDELRRTARYLLELVETASERTVLEG